MHMDSATCEYVWVIIVVVCVCRLDEEYMCRCVGGQVSGGGGQERCYLL